MMQSGWIVRFKDGNIETMSETAYRAYRETSRKENAEVEEHWFDIVDGMKKSRIGRMTI